jgi:micrococcal nuclease
MIFLNAGKHKIAAGTVALVIALVALGTAAASWKVKYVIDGDTVVVEKNNQESTIRLLGINSPEIAHEEYGKIKGECFGKESADFLKGELEGKSIILLQDPAAGDKDKYKRLLRYIVVDGRIVNADMVRNGYAFTYQYSDFFLAKWFYKLEKQAKGEKLGLWGKECQYFSK